MNRHRVACECPFCGLPVHLTVPAAAPRRSGVLAIAASPLVDALALHMRVGCAGR